MDNKKYLEYLQTQAWRDKALQRMKIDNFMCCECGCKGTSENELQVHHITYDRIYEENVYTDLLTLCKACHKGLHKAMERVTSETGRRGWKDSNHVPQVHVYTLSGTDLHLLFQGDQKG